MTALIDTDILIDVALEREPFSEHSSKVLDHAETRSFQAFIAWHSIANFYYTVSSSLQNHHAKEFIKELLNFIKVSPTKTKDALYAGSLDVPDFEDALQIAAAKACNAKYIITRNLIHYKKSPVPAISPEDFIKQFSSNT